MNKTIGRVAIAVAMVICLLGGVLNVGSERAAAQEPTYELLTVLGSGEQISRVLSTNVSIEVSRDGSTVLFTAGSSFNDRDAYVWTRATGHATLLRSGLLPGIVLSSNGRFAGVVDGQSGDGLIIDLVTGSQVVLPAIAQARQGFPLGHVSPQAISDDGTIVASQQVFDAPVGRDHYVAVRHDLVTATNDILAEGDHTSQARTESMTADGRLLAGPFGGPFTDGIYDASVGAVTQVIDSFNNPLLLSDDGNFVFSADFDGMFRTDLRDGSIVQLPADFGDAGDGFVSVRDFVAEGNLVFFTSTRSFPGAEVPRTQTRRMFAYDIAADEFQLAVQDSEFRGADSRLFDPAISRDGTEVVFASSRNLSAADTNERTDLYKRDINAEVVNRDLLCAGEVVTISGAGTIVGTSGRDVILGSSGADVIDGLGGDDLICAGGGDDVVTGGAGADNIFGGDGADRVNGQGGDDRVFGGAGNDVLLGNAGDDVMGGGIGDDRLIGGPGEDSLTGAAGDDWCRGSAGADRYFLCETRIA